MVVAYSGTVQWVFTRRARLTDQPTDRSSHVQRHRCHSYVTAAPTTSRSSLFLRLLYDALKCTRRLYSVGEPFTASVVFEIPEETRHTAAKTTATIPLASMFPMLWRFRPSVRTYTGSTHPPRMSPCRANAPFILFSNKKPVQIARKTARCRS